MTSHYSFHETRQISFSVMRRWTQELFYATGLDDRDAALVADTLVVADSRGVYSHGVLRIPIYTKRILNGCVDITAKPEIIQDSMGTALVEGNNAMGQVVGDFCMRLAMEKAERYGISFVNARGSNHYGTCAYYTMMALEQDMIGISTTIGGGNLMAPWGGSDARVGNNPFSIAIPAGKRYPVVLDMAQSVVAKGKIVMATKTNTPIPADWAFDANGSPTTDAKEGMRGTVRPIADYKGYGLAAVIGLLSSVIAGAAIGASLKDVYEDFSGGLNKGQAFLAISLKHMTDVEAFKERMDNEIGFIKASPPAPGVEEIYLPGEKEYLTSARQHAEGIVYPLEVLEEIREISHKLQVPVPDVF